MRFLGYRDVAGAGADDGNLAAALDGPIPPEANGARAGEILAFRIFLQDFRRRIPVRCG